MNSFQAPGLGTGTSDQSDDADVVVVGGGGSGLAAAIEAATEGARVILLEKAEILGGTTRLSIGSVTATRTDLQRRAGVQDSPDEHFEDMAKFAGPALANRDNLELRRVLVDNVTDSVAWLTGLGVTFFGPMPEPPHRKPRMHNILPNSRAYIYYLSREARRLGIDIRVNCRVHEVVIQQGELRGVVYLSTQGRQTIRARSVVLASGDFSNGSDLKREYAPQFANTDAINPNSTGDGHVIGLKLGAKIVNGDIQAAQMRFVQPSRPNLLLRLPPIKPLTWSMQAAMQWLPSWILRPFILSFVTTYLAPEPTLFSAGAILVNQDGLRFADELSNPSREVPSQRGKTAYLILDKKLVDKFSRWPDFVSTAPGVAYAYVPDYRRTRKDIYHEASDFHALGRALGMPSGALQATVDEYNANSGQHPRGARPTLSGGPYVALGPVRNWVIIGEGGLAVTARHEVKGADDLPIPGLFAAGSAGQGGLLLEGHGHHLGWGFTSGRRAGRHATQFSKAVTSKHSDRRRN